MVDNFFGEVISKYTEEQAVEDGLLVELKIFKNTIKDIDAPTAPFSHVTTNLMSKGYMTANRDGTNNVTFNFPNILDLLNQALQILKRGKRGDWHYQGEIELPNGTQQLILIEQNGTGKFTIMLPEDR